MQNQNSKIKLITPFLMLFAGALAAIIMFLKKYDFYTMLWVLLIVLIVFYVIGDIVRYLYMSVQPRILPKSEIERMIAMMEEELRIEDGEVTESDMEEDSEEKDSEFEMDEEGSMDDESVDEYTDENLDEM